MQMIVFPTNTPDGLLSKRGAHFGRARFYTLVAVNADGAVVDVTVTPNPGHSAGGCQSVVSLIGGLGADTLVVSGIGASPLEGFLKHGIRVYRDTHSPNVGEALSQILSGASQPMEPSMACGSAG